MKEIYEVDTPALKRLYVKPKRLIKKGFMEEARRVFIRRKGFKALCEEIFKENLKGLPEDVKVEVGGISIFKSLLL